MINIVKKDLRVIVCLVIAFTMAFPSVIYAASKAPSRPSIKYAVATDNTVQISWKKVKNAKNYNVFVQTGDDGWKLWKSVKKNAKNKKKYSDTLKYKLKKSGKKYKVYKRVNPFKKVKTLKNLQYTYRGQYGKRYSFVIQAVNGKSKSKYSSARAVIIPERGTNSDNSEDNAATGSITIDPIGVQIQENDNQYYLTEQTDRVTGSIKNTKDAVRLSYEIQALDSYVLSEGEIAPEENWTIQEVVFANGYNTLTVNVSYKDGSSGSAVIYIYADINNNPADEKLVTTDTDGDGLSDWFELYNSGTDPMKAGDGNADPDGDALTDAEEQDLGSLCHVADSDGDELNDYDERSFGTDSMNPDTDGDTIADGKEMVLGTDPLVSDAGTSVNAEETASIDSDKNVSVQVSGAAEDVQSLRITPIPETSVISPEHIEGMLGQGLAFNMDGTFDSATVLIDLESGTYDNTLSYGLYYVNEEKAEFERVTNQTISNGRITAELDHFSNYAVISDDDIVSAQKSLKALFNPGSDMYWGGDDCDGDGFKNSVDPTPYSADAFRTYEDYLRYFFPATDAVSMVVQVPVLGSSQVYDLSNGCGHSWMGYWHGSRLGSEEYSELAGFGPAGQKNVELVATYKKGLKSCVKMWDKFRILRTDGSIDDHAYEDYPWLTRESESNMSLALPFATTPDTFNKYNSFIEGYRELYNLYRNNCTTFMLRAFDSMNIKSKVTNYIPEKIYRSDSGYGSIAMSMKGATDGLGELMMSDAGSPGQAGYCIYKYYSYNYVINDSEYVLKDGTKTNAYYSKMSADLANFRSIKNAEQISQMIPGEPNAETSFNGHVYKLYDVGLTWRAAEAWCEENGGHMATVTSQEEQDIIEQLMAEGSRNNYWIGGLSVRDGTVLWVTDEECSYTHWTPGQPDDYNGNENAMMIYRNQNPRDRYSGFGLWNDLLEDGTCNNESFFGMNNFGFIFESDE